ncbi:STAS domain-containing protein [Lacipirellula sp.]|uniref:STAS domain-containing protein n=1 Tax=Lacipirellula sp. TaxID=2691419 RepID=UPI003D11FAF1
MADVCEEWGVDVSRGPDWLFLRLRPGKQEPAGMADKIWSLADRHFVYRLVLEMNDVSMIPSHLMGQLVMLQKRVLQREGALRLCGLSKECAEALRFCRLDQALPNFASLEDAVKGQRRHAPHFRERAGSGLSA